jgi:hypothetical protein
MIEIVNIIILIVLCVLLITILLHKQKEKYCVDISGGLKPPCNCNGYREVRS